MMVVDDEFCLLTYGTMLTEGIRKESTSIETHTRYFNNYLKIIK
jgi:hypothetical protein